jgi:hypothetical protein
MYPVPTMYPAAECFFHGVHLALFIGTLAGLIFHGLHPALFISTLGGLKFSTGYTDNRILDVDLQFEIFLNTSTTSLSEI